MNAPARTEAPPAPTLGQAERAAQVRECIHAQMWLAGVYAGIVQDFACAGDDAGISYGLEKLGLYVRTALELRGDLEAIRLETAEPAGGA